MPNMDTNMGQNISLNMSPNVGLNMVKSVLVFWGQYIVGRNDYDGLNL